MLDVDKSTLTVLVSRHCLVMSKGGIFHQKWQLVAGLGSVLDGRVQDMSLFLAIEGEVVRVIEDSTD